MIDNFVYKECFLIDYSNYTFKYGNVLCLFDTGSDMCLWKGSTDSFVKKFGNNKTVYTAIMQSYNGVVTVADIYLATLRFKYLTCKNVPIAVGRDMPINESSFAQLTISPSIVFRDINLLLDACKSRVFIGLPNNKHYYNKNVIINRTPNNLITDVTVVNEEINIASDTCPVCGSKLLSIGRCVNHECYFEL